MAAPQTANIVDFTLNIDINDNIDQTISKVDTLSQKLESATDTQQNAEFSNYVDIQSATEPFLQMKAALSDITLGLNNLKAIGTTATIGLGMSFEDMQRRLTTSAIDINQILERIGTSFNNNMSTPIRQSFDSIMLKVGKARADVQRLYAISAMQASSRIGNIQISDIEAHEVALRSLTERLGKQYNSQPGHRNGGNLESISRQIADENSVFSKYIKKQWGDQDDATRQDIAKYIMLRDFHNTAFNDYDKYYRQRNRQYQEIAATPEELLPKSFRQTYNAIISGQTPAYNSKTKDPRVEKTLNKNEVKSLQKVLRRADRFDLLSSIFESAGIAQRDATGVRLADTIYRSDINQLAYALTKAYDVEKRGVYGFERNPLDSADYSRLMGSNNRRAGTIADAIDYISGRFKWVTPSDMNEYNTAQGFNPVHTFGNRRPIINRRLDYPDTFYIPRVRLENGMPVITIKDKNGNSRNVDFVDPETYDANMEDILQAQRAAKYREDVPEIPYVTISDSYFARKLGMVGNGTLGNDRANGKIVKNGKFHVIQTSLRDRYTADEDSNKLVDYIRDPNDPTFFEDYFRRKRGFKFGPTGKQQEFMYAFQDGTDAWAVDKDAYERIVNDENSRLGTNLFQNYNINGIIQRERENTFKQIDVARKALSPSVEAKKKGLDFGSRRIVAINTDIMNLANGLRKEDSLDGAMLIDPSVINPNNLKDIPGFAAQFRFLNVGKGMMQSTDWRKIIEESHLFDVQVPVTVNGQTQQKNKHGLNELFFKDSNGKLHAYAAGTALEDAFAYIKDANGENLGIKESKNTAIELVRALQHPDYFSKDPGKALQLKERLSKVLESSVDLSAKTSLSQDNIDEIRRRFFVDVMDQSIAGIMSNTTIKNTTGFRYLTLPVYQRLFGNRARNMTQLQKEHSLLSMEDYKNVTGDIEDNPLNRKADGTYHRVVKLNQEEVEEGMKQFAGNDFNAAIGLMNLDKNFETMKDYISRQMFVAIGSPEELLRQSNENYKKRREGLEDKSYIKKHFIDSDERLSRMYKQMGPALLDSPEVKRLIEAERSDLYNKQFLEHRLLLPGTKYSGLATIGIRDIASSLIADENITDDIKDLIKNGTLNPGVAFLMSQGLKGVQMPNGMVDGSEAIVAPAVRAFVKKHGIDLSSTLNLAGRNPASASTIIKSMLDIPDDALKKVKEYGYSDNAIILSAAQQYKHNTGDFDGDTIDLLMVQFSASVKEAYETMMSELEKAQKELDAQKQNNPNLVIKGDAKKEDNTPFVPIKGKTTEDLYKNGEYSAIFFGQGAGKVNSVFDMGLTSSMMDAASSSVTDPDRYKKILRFIRLYDDATTGAKTATSINLADMNLVSGFRHSLKADKQLADAIASGLPPEATILNAKPVSIKDDISSVMLSHINRQEIAAGRVPLDRTALYRREFLSQLVEGTDSEDSAIYKMAMQYAKIQDGVSTINRVIEQEDIDTFEDTIKEAEKHHNQLVANYAITHEDVFLEDADKVQKYIDMAHSALNFITSDKGFTRENLEGRIEDIKSKDNVTDLSATLADLRKKERYLLIGRQNMKAKLADQNLSQADRPKYEKGLQLVESRLKDISPKIDRLHEAEVYQTALDDPGKLREMFDALWGIEDEVQDEETKARNEQIKALTEKNGANGTETARLTALFLKRINRKSANGATQLRNALSNGATSIEKFMDLNELRQLGFKGESGTVAMLNGTAAPDQTNIDITPSANIIGRGSQYRPGNLRDTLVSAYLGHFDHDDTDISAAALLGKSVHRAIELYSTGQNQGLGLRELIKQQILNAPKERVAAGLNEVFSAPVDANGEITRIIDLKYRDNSDNLTEKWVDTFLNNQAPDRWTNFENLFNSQKNGGWENWMSEGVFPTSVNGKEVKLLMPPVEGVNSYKETAVSPDFIQKRVDQQTNKVSFRMIDWKPGDEEAETTLYQNLIYLGHFQRKAKELAKEMDAGGLSAENEKYRVLLELMEPDSQGKYFDANGNVNFREFSIAGYDYVHDKAYASGKVIPQQLIDSVRNLYEKGVASQDEFFKAFTEDIGNLPAEQQEILGNAVRKVFNRKATRLEAEKRAHDTISNAKQYAGTASSFANNLLADKFQNDIEKMDELDKTLYKEEYKYNPYELSGRNRFATYRKTLKEMLDQDALNAFAVRATAKGDEQGTKLANDMIADAEEKRRLAEQRINELEREATAKDPGIAALNISKSIYGSDAQDIIGHTRNMYMSYEDAAKIGKDFIARKDVLTPAGKAIYDSGKTDDEIRNLLSTGVDLFNNSADEKAYQEHVKSLGALKDQIDANIKYVGKNQIRKDNKSLQKIKGLFGEDQNIADKVSDYYDGIWLEIEGNINAQKNAITELENMLTKDKYKNNPEMKLIIERIIDNKNKIITEIEKSLTPTSMADKMSKDLVDQIRKIKETQLGGKDSSLVKTSQEMSKNYTTSKASVDKILHDMLEDAKAHHFYDPVYGWGITSQAQAAKLNYEQRKSTLQTNLAELSAANGTYFDELIEKDKSNVAAISEPIRFNLRENVVENIRRKYLAQMNDINNTIKDYETEYDQANQAYKEAKNKPIGEYDQEEVDRQRKIKDNASDAINTLNTDRSIIKGYFEQDGFVEEQRRIDRAARDTDIRNFLFGNRKYGNSPVLRTAVGIIGKENDLKEERQAITDSIKIFENQKKAYEEKQIELQDKLTKNGKLSAEDQSVFDTLPESIKRCDTEINSLNESLKQTMAELDAIGKGESLKSFANEVQKIYRDMNLNASGLRKNSFIDEASYVNSYFNTVQDSMNKIRDESESYDKTSGQWKSQEAQDEWNRLNQILQSQSSAKVYRNLRERYRRQDADELRAASRTRFGGRITSINDYYNNESRNNNVAIAQITADMEGLQEKINDSSIDQNLADQYQQRYYELAAKRTQYQALNTRNNRLQAIDKLDVRKKYDIAHDMTQYTMQKSDLSHEQKMYSMVRRRRGMGFFSRASDEIYNNRNAAQNTNIEIDRLTRENEGLRDSIQSDRQRLRNITDVNTRRDIRSQIRANEDKFNVNANNINHLQEERDAYDALSNPGIALMRTAFDSISMYISRAITMYFRKMIQTAKQFVAQFNTAMAEIQKVTLKTDSEMEKLGDSLIQKAVDMKTSIAEVTKAAQELYKQGLNDNQVNSRLDDLLKFSKVSGQSVEGASKLGIVALNSGMVGNTMEAYDTITAMANRTATDVNSLAVATQKSIYQGKAAGLTYDQLVAMLDAVLSKTQLSGAVTGTAVSNVLSRIMKIGSTGYVYDESGYKTSGEQLSKLLSSVGIDTYKQGKMVSPFTILSQIGQKYSRMDDVTKNAIATQLGGRGGQQASNVRSLLDAFSELDANGRSLIEVLTELAATADGIVDKQYDVEMEKIAAKQAALTASFSKLVDALPVEEGQKAFLDMSNVFVEGLASFASAGDGIVGILGTIAAVAAPLIAGGLTGAGSALTTAIPLLGTLGATLGAIAPPLLALVGTIAAFAAIGQGIKWFGEEKKYNSEEERNKRLVNSYKAEASAYASRASSGNSAYETASSYNAQILKGETLNQQQLRDYRSSLLSLQQMGYVASDVPTSLDKLAESAEQTAKALGEVPKAIDNDKKMSANKNFNAFVAGIKTDADKYENKDSIESFAKSEKFSAPYYTTTYGDIRDVSSKKLNQMADLVEFIVEHNFASRDEVQGTLARYGVTTDDLRNKKGHYLDAYEALFPELNRVFYNDDGSFKVPEGFSATDTESFIMEKMDVTPLKATFASMGYTEEAIDAEINKLKEELLNSKDENGTPLTSLSRDEATPIIQNIINERYGYTDGIGQWKLKDIPFEGEKTTYTSLGALMSASLGQVVSTESSLGLYNEIVRNLPEAGVPVSAADMNRLIENTAHRNEETGEVDSSFLRFLDSNENLKTQFNDLFDFSSETGVVSAKEGVLQSEIDSFIRNLRTIASSVGDVYSYVSDMDIGKRAQETLGALQNGGNPETLYANSEENKARLAELTKLAGPDAVEKYDHAYVQAVVNAAAQGRQASFSRKYFADEAVREIASADRGEWATYKENNPAQLIEKTQSTFDGLAEYISLSSLSDEELAKTGFNREYVNKLKERLAKTINAIQMLGVDATDKSIQFFEGLSSEIDSERIQTQATMTSQLEKGNRINELATKLRNQTNDIAYYEIEEMAEVLNVDVTKISEAIEAGNIDYYVSALSDIANENLDAVISTYTAKIEEALLTTTYRLGANMSSQDIASYLKAAGQDKLAEDVITKGFYTDENGDLRSENTSHKTSAQLYYDDLDKNNTLVYRKAAKYVEGLMTNDPDISMETAADMLYENMGSLVETLGQNDADIRAGIVDRTKRIAGLQKILSSGEKGYLLKENNDHTYKAAIAQYDSALGNKELNDNDITSLTPYITDAKNLRNVESTSEEAQILREKLASGIYEREASYNPAILRKLLTFVADKDQQGLLDYYRSFETDDAKNVLNTLTGFNIESLADETDTDKIKDYMNKAFTALLNALFVSTGLTKAKTWATAVNNKDVDPSTYYETVQSARQQASNYVLVQRAMASRGTYASDQILKSVFGLDDNQLKDNKFVQERFESFKDDVEKAVDGFLDANGLNLEDVSNMDQLPESVRDFLEFVGIEIEDGAVNIDTSILTDSIQNIIDNTAKELTNNSNMVQYSKLLEIYNNSDQEHLVDDIQAAVNSGEVSETFIKNNPELAHLISEATKNGRQLGQGAYDSLGVFLEKNMSGTYGKNYSDYNNMFEYAFGSSADYASLWGDAEAANLVETIKELSSGSEEDLLYLENLQKILNQISGGTLGDLAIQAANGTVSMKQLSSAFNTAGASVTKNFYENVNAGKENLSELSSIVDNVAAGGERMYDALSSGSKGIVRMNDVMKAFNQFQSGFAGLGKQERDHAISLLSSYGEKHGYSSYSFEAAMKDKSLRNTMVGAISPDIEFDWANAKAEFEAGFDQGMTDLINLVDQSEIDAETKANIIALAQVDPSAALAAIAANETLIKNDAIQKLAGQLSTQLSIVASVGVDVTGAVTRDPLTGKLTYASDITKPTAKSYSGGGFNKNSGSKGKSDAEKLVDRLKKGQELYDHRIKMYQYEETRYQNLDQLANYGRVLQKEIDIEKAYLPVLNENIDALKRQLDATKTGTDDWYTVREALLAAEEKYAEITNTIDENTKKLRENQKAILQTHTSLEDMVKQEIENRIQRQRDMLAGNVSMQDTILDAVKARYEREWQLIKDDIDQKKKALEEEKALIDERLNKRKSAEDEAQKYEQLAELKRQYALVSMDSSRTKDAANLRKQISDLEKEIGWDLAEQEAQAMSDAIQSQIDAYDEFASTGDEDLDKLLEDANNFGVEVKRILGMSHDDLMAWLSSNDDSYRNSLSLSQQQIMQDWEDTWKQMYGIVDTYWDQINEILSSEDSFTRYMTQSIDYTTASLDAQRIMMLEWAEAYEKYLKASILDENYFHGIHDGDLYGSERVFTSGSGSSSGGGGGGGSGSSSSSGNNKTTSKVTQNIIDNAAKSVVNAANAAIGQLKLSDGTVIDAVTSAQPNLGLFDDSFKNVITQSVRSTNQGVNYQSSTGNLDGIDYVRSLVLNDIKNSGAGTSTSSKAAASSQSTSAKGTATVSANGSARLRSGPGTDYSQVGSIASGQTLTITGKSGNWYNTNKGWISGNLLKNIKTYDKGGLADFTGLIQIDGTKKEPERILNAHQTKSFDRLVDIMDNGIVNSLENVFSEMDHWSTFAAVTPTVPYFDIPEVSETTQTIGDIYVTLNEAKLESDADYAEVADRVGRLFKKELSKRGFTSMNY